MTVYLIIISLLIVGVYRFDYKKKKVGKETYFLLMLLLFISLAGLRFEVGGDTLRYMRGFRNMVVGLTMDSVQMGEKNQPLAVLIFGGIKISGGEFWLIQLIYAVIFNIIIFWFINKYSPHRYTCLLLYFIFFYPKLNFEVIRESLAIAFFMIGFVYLNKGKIWVYWLCTLGAFLSHISGLFMIFFLIIRKIPVTPLFLLLYIVLSFILSFFSDTILLQFSSIGNVSSWVEYQSTMVGKITIIIKAIIYPLIVYYVVKCQNISPVILKALKLYPLIGCAELAIFILYRYENYMIPIMIIGLGSIVYSIPITRIYKRLINALSVVILALLVYIPPYFASISNEKYIPYYEFWIPYYSIFDQNQDTGRRALLSLWGK